jgi:type II secretory pathway predicted ATPase ExeA
LRGDSEPPFLHGCDSGQAENALTAVIGSGKTILSRRLRIDLEREGRVIVSRSLSVDKAKITVPLLIAALFYDLSPEKAVVTISSQSERRERDLQELFRRAKKPLALFIDDAHELHPKTLVALKRLIELVTEGGRQLSIVLIGHPKLKNDLRRPKMEEIGDRTTVFEFGGLRDRQRDYIDWVLKASLDEYVMPTDVVTEEAATILAAKLKTPLQIGQHLVRAFEAGFEIGAKPIDASVIEATLSRQLNDLEPQLTRNGYDVRSLVEQFDAEPSEIRQLLRGDLDPGRSRNLWTKCALPVCQHERLNDCASNCTISRLSQRPCVESQITCVGGLLQSQVMCARNGS